MNCPTNEQLSAYYDRRLDAVSGVALADAAASDAHIAEHLTACPACAAEMSRLAELSRLLAAVPEPRLDARQLQRLHQRADIFMQIGVRRLAWMVDAIAACLLIASSIWLMHGQGKASAALPAAAAALPPWVKVDAPGDTDSLAREGSSPVAQWYLADASGNKDEP